NPAISIAVVMDAIPVTAPALKLTTDRLSPPATGYPCEKAAARFALPTARSSWLASTFSRRRAASDLPTEMLSRKLTKLIATACGKSDRQSAKSQDGIEKPGRPRGTLPTTATPSLVANESAQTRMLHRITTRSGPLLDMSWVNAP